MTATMQAMKRERIPPCWRHLHPGDQVGSRLPLHRIQRHLAALESEGFTFRMVPSPTGYWLVCETRPKGEQNAAEHGAADPARSVGRLRLVIDNPGAPGFRPSRRPHRGQGKP